MKICEDEVKKKRWIVVGKYLEEKEAEVKKTFCFWINRSEQTDKYKKKKEVG